MKTTGAEIHVVKGGQGPPLLLLHGAPQTHITWRLVAPLLMKDYTLVIPDLRGYGDSSKPADTPDHSNYSKRNMALDMVEVMKSFGFDRFPVVGQDRGGRVGHRLAVDHPDKVTKLAVLDIVPTHYHYTHVTLDFAQAYPHWFNYLQPAPGPENELKATNDANATRDDDRFREGVFADQHGHGQPPRHVRGLPCGRVNRLEVRRRRHQERQEDHAARC